MAAAADLSRRFILQDIEIEEFTGECFPYQLYFTTNEREQKKTLERLKKIESLTNTYLGTSGLFNLNAASIRKNIEYIVIFDRSYVVQRFWHLFRTIIIATPDREETVKRLEAMINENKELFFGNMRSRKFKSLNELAIRHIEKLQKEISDKISFLSDDIKYNRIREIFLKGNFRFLRMDLNDPGSFIKLGKDFRKKGLFVDILYASNARDYCNDENYILSLMPFIFRTTVLIDTYPRYLRRGLEQRVRQNLFNRQIEDFIRG